MARRGIMIAGAVMILLTACSREGRDTLSSKVPHDQDVNWDNPIDGVPVASLTQAAQSMPFQVSQPMGLGTPARILVSRPDVPTEGRSVAFVFDTASYGRVIVFERLPEVDPSQYDVTNEHLVAIFNGPGALEIDLVRGGTKALVATTAEGRTGVYWLEGKIEFYVSGPTLTKTDALQIVNGI
jgi:hypothetical protein